MDHARATQVLPAYESGALGREETRDLHAHFKACEACQSRIRLRRAAAQAGGPGRLRPRGPEDPETQRMMARNRDLLVKILLLLVAAWAVFKWRR